MPCTMTGSFEGDQAMAAKREADRVTAYLCAVLRYLETMYPDVVDEMMDLSKAGDGQIDQWWHRHKKEDLAKRMKKMGVFDFDPEKERIIE